MSIRSIMICNSCGNEIDQTKREFYLIARYKEGVSYTSSVPDFIADTQHLCKPCNRILDNFLGVDKK